MKKVTRFDIGIEENINGEYYHFHDMNNHSGEYVFYSDVEEVGTKEKEEIPYG